MGKGTRDSEKQRYHLIVGLLIAIIVLLIGIIAVVLLKGQSASTTVQESNNVSTISSKAPVKNTTSTASNETHLSQETHSTKMSVSKESTKSSSSEPTISVSDLTTQQRAALIILGAPVGWKFNGYPSTTTVGDTIQEMAISDTNQITLSTSNQEDYRTNPDDQRFDVLGKDLDGLGGIIIDMYAFGREENNIYYYVIHQNFQAANPRQEVNSLGVADIDTIWKRYVATHDTQTVDLIASHILLK